MSKERVSPEMLRELFRYDAESGHLYWLVRAPGLFRATTIHTPKMRADAWNTKWAGKRAGHLGNDGYWLVRIFGVNHKAHRVVFAIHYGKWPENNIDHINHDKSDNRIVNLRDVTQRENNRNASPRTKTKTGVMGVYRCPHSGSWMAYIRANGRQRHLGSFADLESAADARKAAERQLGFHENHGALRERLGLPPMQWARK